MRSGKLTRPEIAEAWAMWGRDKRSWRAIAKHFGLSREGLRRQIDIDYRDKRNTYQKRWMATEARVFGPHKARRKKTSDQDHHHRLPQPRDQVRSGLAAR
jgi:hypothetical protein